MAALGLRRLQGASAQGRTCDTADCIRKARFKLLLCGHTVPSESSWGLKVEQATMCEPCAREAKRIFERYTNAGRRRLALEAVKAFGRSASKRVDAVDALRDLGFNEIETARAVKGWKDGLDAEQVVAKLLGEDVEREAIAA